MPTSETSKKRKKETFTISFRVDNHHLNQLEKGAASYGISVHEYARQRLIELLERQDEAQLLEKTDATRRSVEGLRNDMAATLEVILLNTVKTDPAKIRGWIDENLRRDDASKEG
jgi:sugar diacid utilization regulator